MADLDMNDRDALREVKTRWAAALDDAVRAGTQESVVDAASRWTQDARLDLGPMGVFEQRSGIERFVRETAQAFESTLHVLTNPFFDIDGDEASGHWYASVYVKPLGAPEHELMNGIHEDIYARVNGVWYLKQQMLVLLG